MDKQKKIKFTDADEEKIIDFVKSHEVLYQVKHPKFRDSEAKNRLWLSLAKELNKDGMYFRFEFLYRRNLYWIYFNVHFQLK